MTPLMRQYWDIKSVHPDKIVLFRMGDFYEMFFDDAVKAAPILNIALTSRNKKSQDETPMCGVPHHSIAGPINKLLAAGLKVAICEQMEDPKQAKGIVKRAVTRVLTPGMVYDSDTLDASLNHFIAALDGADAAFVDTTTGDAFYFQNLSASEIKRLLASLPVAELVLQDETPSPLPENSRVLLSRHQATEEFADVKVCNLLLSYIGSLSNQDPLKSLKPFEARQLSQRLDLSSTVVRHLELFNNYRGEVQGSFFHAINRCQTSAGSRLLRQWVGFPLVMATDILERQKQIAAWVAAPARLKKLREILGTQGDLERRLGKLTSSGSNSRDLLSLIQAIEVSLKVLDFTETTVPAQSQLAQIVQKTALALVDDPPLQIKQGGMIRKGYDAALDELITLATDSQSLVSALELREKEKTGISSLKVRYNNVFGFYIEITNLHREKAPAHYMRKQTLANAERFCTDELIELEKKVLSSQARRSEVEFEIFENLKNETLALASQILTLANVCSHLDVISGLAWLAIERRYVRPEFQSGSKKDIQITASRHPVIEQLLRTQFVANDIQIHDQGCMLLTGPNMAGKSTLMRQVALTVILAQMGSFVPAEKARLPIFQHLFTRIGASDQLSEGLSTFMVEMTESAEMLQKSGDGTLVILDEIGRGTSTFDGMSLAQAILEYLLTRVKCVTLFATHYHELTNISQVYPQVQNAHMAVSDRGGEIRFLHSLRAGPAQKSYGIHVAKLAGIPSEVTARAEKLLREKEQAKSAGTQLQLTDMELPSAPAAELDPTLKALLAELKDFSLSNKTPLEAMVKIAQWQQHLSSTQNH